MFRDKRSIVATALLVALSALPLTGCQGQVNDRSSGRPTVIKVSSTLADMSIEEMAESATVVTLGKVERKGGAFRVDEPSGDDRAPGSTEPMVYTEWTVVPQKVFKTDGDVAPGKPIRVALRGGETPGLVMENDSEAVFAPGEKVLLFLTQAGEAYASAPGRYFTYAAMAGKYKIGDDGIARNRDTRKDARLSDIEAKLK